MDLHGRGGGKILRVSYPCELTAILTVSTRPAPAHARQTPGEESLGKWAWSPNINRETIDIWLFPRKRRLVLLNGVTPARLAKLQAGPAPKCSWVTQRRLDRGKSKIQSWVSGKVKVDSMDWKRVKHDQRHYRTFSECIFMSMWPACIYVYHA